MKKSILFFAFLSISYALFSQQLTQTLKGQVLDAQSQAPIIGANVIVLGINPIMGTVSNLEGEFRIDNVPVGRHSIKISFIGYEAKIIPELLVASGKEVDLTIQLVESISQLEEIEVVASKQNKGDANNDMATVSAISFSMEETSRYAASFDDPARAVLSFAGVAASGNDETNEIVIRGNSPRGVLWRIEGVEVPNPNHFAEDGASAGIVSMLSSTVMSNSDFFTGAFPAQYGNALSGVFDINLRNGNKDKREYAFQAGILGVQAGLEGPFKKGGKSSYLLNYRYSTLALFDNIGIDLIGDQETLTFQDLNFKFNFPTKKLGNISLWGVSGISENDYRAAVEFDEKYSDNWKTQMGVVGMTHRFFMGKDTYMENVLSVSGTKNFYNEDSLKVKITESEDFTNTAIRFSSLLNHKFNAKNTLRAGIIVSQLGFDLQSSYYSNFHNKLISDLNKDGNTFTLQAYTQWQYRMSKKVTLNSGLHYSRFLLNDNQTIEPRLGLSWKLSPNQSINVGWGMHSRLETISLYMAQAEQEDGSILQANKDLDYSKAMHYVLGYEQKLGSDWRLKIETYYQHLYDVPVRPSYLTAPWEVTFSSINQSDGYTSAKLVNEGIATNYGVEFTLEKFFSKNYYMILTASLFESNYEGRDGKTYNTRFNTKKAVNLIAGKEFILGKNKNNILGLNSRLIWSGGIRDIPIDLDLSKENGFEVRKWEEGYNSQLPDYMRWDVGISYRKNKAKHSTVVSLNIQNVTGRVNAASSYYNSSFQTVIYDEQLGMLPVFNYRYEF